MTVTPKQLENLKKGTKFNERTTEELRRIAVAGGKASGEARSLKPIFQASVMKHLLTEVKDQRKRSTLKDAGLPPTYLGLLIFNSAGKAGVNGGMFESFAKAAGIIDQDQTNVNINNTPIIISGDDKLED